MRNGNVSKNEHNKRRFDEMHQTDPEQVSLVTYLWVLFWSGFGGFASFIGRVRSGKIRHNFWLELFADAIYSAFAGMMAFYWCHYQGYGEMLSAIVIGMSGHMGARMIILIENALSGKIN